MINYIKKDPLFKRAFIIMLSFMVALSILIMILNYYNLKSFYNNQMLITEKLVGTFVKKYPEDEIKIIDSLLTTNENENISFGKTLLDKYGYKNSFSLNNNVNSNNSYKNFMLQSIVQCIFFIIISIDVFLYIIKHLTKDIMIFSKAAEKIMDGDFSIAIDTTKEGILSTLRYQFHQMSNRLYMSIENLDKEKESMKSVVTAMSHQLKTPVASLKLSNSLLLENDLTIDERNEFLQKCNEDIEKLEWLVSSLIKMSRMEIGSIELNKEKSSIKNTIIKAVNGVYMKALDKNIDINMEYLQDGLIEHDVKWTKEALGNILENAVKYTHNGGKIKITTTYLPSIFKINIEDNGIGIPEKEINNIFQKFYRGNCKEVNNAEGLGVGLYLTRKIIEHQGGSIIVHSRKGNGSTFSVLLQNCHEN